MNTDPAGVPVARHMVWRHVWRVRIEPITTRRSRLSALPSKPVRRSPATDPLDCHDPLAASRGTLFALVLCVPFWVGVY